MTKSYYEFEGFCNPNFQLTDYFEINQEEIKFDKQLESGKISFKKQNITYKCYWTESNDYDSEKPTIIIPTKNMSQLLHKTLKNLQDNDITSICNIMIVDDMSDEDIKTISGKHSYLKIENKKGFNFSMLNNIAALVCYKKNNKQIIFWNNDLYANSKEMMLEFLKRHNENNSTISGSKLLYPPKDISFTKEEDSENINEFFKQVKGKWRNTIQYGGTRFLPLMPHIQKLSPYHYMRFRNPLDPRVNCDKGTDCLTGALMIVELKQFLEIGGFNPSLPKNFQDTDLCLKFIKNNKNIFYFGKDIHFYHDESVSLAGKKVGDEQFKSDQVLFGKIWNEQILGLIT